MKANQSVNSSILKYGCTWTDSYNATEAQERSEYSFVVCYPILLFFCTIGNFLTIAVFGTIRHVPSADVLLLALAVGDLLTVWIYFPEYMFVVNPDIFNSIYTFDYVNDYIQGLYIWLQIGFPRFADWVLVVFSIERFRAIVRAHLTYPVSAKVSRILVLTCFLYGIVTCIDKAVAQYYLLAVLDITNFDVETSLAFPSSLPRNIQTWNTISTIYGLVETFVVFTILLVCNATIIYKILTYHRDGARLHTQLVFTAEPGVSNVPHRGKQKIEAPLLVSAVSMYLICRLPAAINDTLGQLSQYPFCSVNYQNYDVLWRPLDSIKLIPYSVNFYLYCAFSTKFRKRVKATYTAFVWRARLWKKKLRGDQEGADLVSNDSRINSPQLKTRRPKIPPVGKGREIPEKTQLFVVFGKEENSGSSMETTTTVTTRL
ncbi:sex peptide receptor-like [Paramacrobiotus metropolitanus]|uniref:sex peptide receptor-like n=1 Tax=Paramacrobiotus metropolitanus TaxID=2943436 RepID=UPI0024462676|nr:sex peptide receptor-like [Paramacrobiotus metropolitanus]